MAHEAGGTASAADTRRKSSEPVDAPARANAPAAPSTIASAAPAPSARKTNATPTIATQPQSASVPPPAASPAPSAARPALAAGQRVAVQWADGQHYAGSVVQVAAGQALIGFQDGRQLWVAEPYLSLC